MAHTTPQSFWTLAAKKKKTTNSELAPAPGNYMFPGNQYKQ